MTINKGKYGFNCERISYIEYQIKNVWISPDERLNKKITEIFILRYTKKLESF